MPDYFDVIKKPMCWKYIDAKLDRNEYIDDPNVRVRVLPSQAQRQICRDTAFDCYREYGVRTRQHLELTKSQFGTVVAYWLDYGTIKNLTGEV